MNSKMPQENPNTQPPEKFNPNVPGVGVPPLKEHRDGRDRVAVLEDNVIVVVRPASPTLEIPVDEIVKWFTENHNVSTEELVGEDSCGVVDNVAGRDPAC